ncbi:hypothetical protein J7643_07870 [bacterium]|nr:hypothetical protein [bacterium]
MTKHVATLAVLLALAPAAMAAPDPDKRDWERFLTQEVPTERVLADWLGRAPELDTEGPEGRHFLIRDRAPYAGGVDVYATGKGDVQEVIYYLVEGPLYLESQVKRALTLKSPYTVDDVERWYGKPFERRVSSRSGATILTYHFAGDTKRELTFSSLPGSKYLHRIVVTRGE